MGLFDRRSEFKPFEYQEAEGFKHAINHSYWLVSEFNFLADVHDYKTNMSDHEKQVLEDTLLAISQVEVAVKRFWGDIGKTIPKPEIQQVGVTFAESEVRHADAYSHLLHVMGLNQSFQRVLTVPCMRSRVEFLDSFRPTDPESFVRALAVFSSMIENVSLFAQFAIIKSFNKDRAILKDVDNVVQATQKEETVHALFGQWLVRTVRAEYPQLVRDLDYHLRQYAQDSFLVECDIVDWIYRDGDLPFLPSSALKEFVKSRINESLLGLGSQEFFDVDPGLLEPLRWFDEELHADVHADFFYKRPVTYAKKQQPIKQEDLF